MDATWMAQLKQPQSGFTHLTIKQCTSLQYCCKTNKQADGGDEARNRTHGMGPNRKYQRVFHQHREQAIEIRMLVHHGQNA
jgi:hypothetical protein